MPATGTACQGLIEIPPAARGREGVARWRAEPLRAITRVTVYGCAASGGLRKCRPPGQDPPAPGVEKVHS